ncbi:MerR family transcriptional regulator [Mycolicibacterium conceptionense]|jgi:MerR family redox-sensitive transcriptional activator SoxR|uniref:MerR family transcriptional regulator n=3 Tax=Mycolicibacterium TaxID=1866885 RepID=A0A0J8UBK0_9MYCO|nr:MULTISPECIES: MerR family transcriptional regulator [Mycolicibacterium]KLI08039.1 MerR family transcriptional regulator [Mycolicibacterium senegalense]KLO50569.1 MerR family transcriptional regulator [Mycolicibacterium senegalense]KMV18736.1 MerR family transcriptional regulator [Mycolicibacterium conceptionense]OBJ94085.1 MerR family transcriptional regulator [Mycolicibacterium conceptionense]OMB77322.1 MerR family transcriptional regulator [Mycolicibacterium conceptionense]
MAATLTIGDVTQRTGVAQTALRYYEQVGLLPAPQRVAGQRRYQESVLMRLEVIRLCKAAGFSLSEIGLLLKDDTPGRPVARDLAQSKLAEIDAQLEALARARAIIEWGMRCTCPSIELCTCGIHHDLPV